MKPPSGGSTKDRRMLRCREAKERLERNLENLASYCKPPPDKTAKVDPTADDPLGEWSDKIRVLWPPGELLQEITHDVIALGMVDRKKPILPVWKAFEQVDKRMKKLRLRSRLNDLIRRACAILAGESELGKAARDLEAGKAESRSLVNDILLGKRNLGDLLDEDRLRQSRRAKAYPLVEWVMVIGHPMAKDFGDVAAFFVQDNAAIEKRKILQRRDKTRERQRRRRLKLKKPVENALRKPNE